MNTKKAISNRFLHRNDIAFFLSVYHHRHIDQHVFKEDAVPRGGIVDENVGDRADELSVLDDGRA